MERLQRILCYRLLGFQLEQIKAIIDDPETDPLEHLRRQHVLLIERINELQQIVTTVEKIMEARKMGINLEPHEILEAFGDADPSAYHEEAKHNWGSTNAWSEAQHRTATYTKDDWKRVQAEFTTLMTDIATAHTAGVKPDSQRTMDLAEAHRQYSNAGFTPVAITCIAILAIYMLTIHDLQQNSAHSRPTLQAIYKMQFLPILNVTAPFRLETSNEYTTT